jgi:hypothetical protein
MSDLVFLGIILAFFAFAVLFIRICEHLIGSDDEAVGDVDTEVPVKQAA